jgi:hypothetical protein
MASNLTPEFMAGYNARVALGRCMEHGDKPACPYIATSDSADAWHAGYSFACDCMAGFRTGGEPPRLDTVKATHGRGYRVNVSFRAGCSPWLKMAYAVDYDGGAAYAYMVQS